ncbi:uncharacterized protein LOC124688167 [Lolium rigidum]|uniref:uncharacterized protein LOC124688167 n=1 Tax=Lolium rigidum TaxID=89674 RepID=UPI001F5C13AD|nr:uncharacterized protein LOC124688167 [Lolium rigidum]
MGRGRGRGRKVTIGRSHEEKGSSGEEVVPVRKRRGRPQKHKIEVVDVENFVEDVDGGENEDAKPKKNMVGAAGVKRGRPLKESPNTVLVEENSNSSVRSSSDESARTNGFRQIGNRRKSTPRRAAEAGVECN